MNEIQQLSYEIAVRQAKLLKLKAALKSNMANGQYDGFTIYKVKRTTIRQHIRRCHRAIRVNYSKP